MSGGHVADAMVLERRINIVQGEFHVTDDAEIYLTTILGSCVAACMTDLVAGVGGMNHFLLPGDEAAGSVSMSHGVHAMELLVNGLLQHGARRERLQAKLFGGARMLEGLTDVGRCNADFAERFIKREHIAMTGGSLRGDRGRRVQFWPTKGRVRQLTLGNGEAKVFASERRVVVAKPDSGGVELF